MGNFSLGRHGRHVHSIKTFHVLSASKFVLTRLDFVLSVVWDVLIIPSTTRT